MTESPEAYGERRHGITAGDVERAADALFRAGERPTIEKVRAKIGRGSPNTINPLLDTWWKRLASRLDAGPAALHRVPESVAHVAEALWMQALDEGRRRAAQELSRDARSAAHTKDDLEVRSHVLTLREGEFDVRLKDRERNQATLEAQVRELTVLIRKDRATIDAQSRRIADLERATSSGRAAPGRDVRALPALARQRRVSRARPTRLPESRRARRNSVAVSLPQGTPPKRTAMKSARAKTPRNPKRTGRPTRAGQLLRTNSTKRPKTARRKKSAAGKRRR
jgi:hypothetical protein